MNIINNLEIPKELVYIDKEFCDANDYFDFMMKELKGKYVEDSFLEAIKTREEHFPTGLPIEKCGVAIPHCESENIIIPFISICMLKKPIEFVEIGTDDKVLNVSLIFMLGLFSHDGEQVETLQRLVGRFTDGSYMDGLLASKNKDELYDFLIKNT